MSYANRISPTLNSPVHEREIDKLDRLFGQALLDENIQHRLLNHDEALYVHFGLSRKTQAVLLSQPPMSLSELATSVLRSINDGSQDFSLSAITG